MARGTREHACVGGAMTLESCRTEERAASSSTSTGSASTRRSRARSAAIIWPKIDHVVVDFREQCCARGGDRACAPPQRDHRASTSSAWRHARGCHRRGAAGGEVDAHAPSGRDHTGRLDLAHTRRSQRARAGEERSRGSACIRTGSSGDRRSPASTRAAACHQGGRRPRPPSWALSAQRLCRRVRVASLRRCPHRSRRDRNTATVLARRALGPT